MMSAVIKSMITNIMKTMRTKIMNKKKKIRMMTMMIMIWMKSMPIMRVRIRILRTDELTKTGTTKQKGSRDSYF